LTMRMVLAPTGTPGTRMSLHGSTHEVRSAASLASTAQDGEATEQQR
jgi:hypothetical protein